MLGGGRYVFSAWGETAMGQRAFRRGRWEILVAPAAALCTGYLFIEILSGRYRYDWAVPVGIPAFFLVQALLLIGVPFIRRWASDKGKGENRIRADALTAWDGPGWSEAGPDPDGIEKAAQEVRKGAGGLRGERPLPRAPQAPSEIAEVAQRGGAARRRRKRIFERVVVLLYLITWIGGWSSHARQLRANADASYRNLVLQTEGKRVPFNSRPHAGGPITGIWCVPVLPGVLLVESGTSIAPLSGSGGLKLVLYYGFGSSELCWFYVWLA
jgi:hypothetical protein